MVLLTSMTKWLGPMAPIVSGGLIRVRPESVLRAATKALPEQKRALLMEPEELPPLTGVVTLQFSTLLRLTPEPEGMFTYSPMADSSNRQCETVWVAVTPLFWSYWMPRCAQRMRALWTVVLKLTW